MPLGLGPGHNVLDEDPVGTQPHTAATPHFRPMPIVAKRSPISATAELLLTTNLNYSVFVRRIFKPRVFKLWSTDPCGLQQAARGLQTSQENMLNRPMPHYID